MEKKHPKQKLVLEYDYESICGIWKFEKFFKKHLEAGDKIPARALIKFFSLFKKEEDVIKNEVKKRCDDIKEKTYRRFSNDKDYNFEIELALNMNFPDFWLEGMQESKEEKKGKCNLKEMLDSVFDSITENFLEISVDKKRFILAIYDNIEYYFQMFKGDTQSVLSQYGRKAITGYTAYSFGFHLSKEIRDLNGTEPNNELLVQGVKYYTDKIKKKKETK